MFISIRLFPAVATLQIIALRQSPPDENEWMTGTVKKIVTSKSEQISK